METKYYTLKEISERLKVPVAYLRKAIQNHELKGHFIGRAYVVSENDITSYILSKGVKNER